MYIEELKVTKERIPILIGKNGSIRKQIELRTKTRVKIDSKEGDIQISSEDPLNIYTTKLIINAGALRFGETFWKQMKSCPALLPPLWW